MQATLDAYSLKPFTKALACLAKYGENILIVATPDSLSMSSTNSSMSAYGRFKYGRQFFSKFKVGSHQHLGTTHANEVEEVDVVKGELLAKPLLSILKHRTVEKTVGTCELSILEGALATEDDGQDDPEERDSLENRLIVRLHCKHGVVKTHRLPLLTPTSLLAPGVPNVPYESRLVVDPTVIRDVIERFPFARGPKSDPQLIWIFGESEVKVNSLESSVDSKGKALLSTELTISADEFDIYEVHSPPVTIAFHLREFNATVTFAESMALPLHLRFTDPSDPLFIDIDSSDILFVISTSHVPGHASATSSNSSAKPAMAKSREREGDPPEAARIKKPMKAAQRADPSDIARAVGSNHIPDSGPSTQFRVPGSGSVLPRQNTPGRQQPDPLFLPGSQASLANSQSLQESGLGLEDMAADELMQVLEGEGEEVGAETGPEESRPPGGGIDEYYGEGDVDYGRDSFELVEEPELAPTQAGSGETGSKAFKPLFQD